MRTFGAVLGVGFLATDGFTLANMVVVLVVAKNIIATLGGESADSNTEASTENSTSQQVQTSPQQTN